jgi:hypothetical protein
MAFGGMIKPVAMGPHEAKDPFRELDLGVQIVCGPPTKTFFQ